MLENKVSAAVGLSSESGATAVPDQNHLLLELPGRIVLGTDFVIHVKELLQGLALGGHYEANNVHQELRHGITIEHDCQDTLHSLLLCFIATLLELCPKVLKRGLVGRVVLVDQTV